LRRVRFFSVAGLVLCSASGCLQIADIQERKYDSTLDGGARDGAVIDLTFPNKDQCQGYCDAVQESCPEAFKDPAYCEKICPHLPLSGQAGVKTGNTFECRLDQVTTAAQIGPDDSREHCLRAGPAGGGACGSSCDAYCQLFSTVCADHPQLATDCKKQCEKLVAAPTLDARESFSAPEATEQVDTIQCRLAHVSAAAFAPDPHCEHASLYVDKLTPCYTAKPNCFDYCTLMQNICTDDAGSDGEDMQQYESFEDCRQLCTKGLTVSEELMAMETQDKTRDTLACRRYHVYNHLLFKGSHCEHAGPGGDGHCGRICPAYCKLVKAACPGPFATEYGTDAACVSNCSDLINIADTDKQIDLHYNVAQGKAGGNNIQCRLYHTTKAFRTSASCESALGGGSCAP
jgi:hypothetical protein